MSDSTIISAPASQRLTRLKVGLAIGFGVPFVLGVAYQVCALFGWSVDFNGARLLVELGVLGALLMLTLQYERLPLGSLGIHKIRAQEIYFGLAVGVALIALSAAAAELLPHRGAVGAGDFETLLRAMAPADSSGLGPAPIWLALPMVIVSALAEELVARGYAIRRLREITGTSALAAAAALAIDLIARLPLWGLRYTIVVLPAEIVLVALFVWRRQLVTCMVAHLTLALTIFFAIRIIGGPSTFSDRAIDATARPSLKEEMAVVELRRALGQTTGPGSAAAQSAETFYVKHDFAHALEQIEDAIRAQPTNRAYLGMRAAVHAAQDNIYGAIADYTQMLALDSKDVEVYRERARQYKLMRDYRNAAADLESAIKLAPKDALNFEERASLHYWQQQYSEAIADLSTAIALDPANRRLLVDRAVFYEHIGHHSRALEDCGTLVSRDPAKADGYECRVDVYMSMGDAKAAMTNLDMAISRDPDDPQLYANRGELQIAAGKWREAHLDFEKVASLNPDNPQTSDGVAWALATSARDEVRDGKAALALAIHENELTGYNRYKYLETLAAAYAEVGDTASAVRWEMAALAASDAGDPDDREQMRRRLRIFDRGRALRETDTSAFASPRPVSAMIAVIITLSLAAVGLVALLYWSARWSLRRAKRMPPVPAA